MLHSSGSGSSRRLAPTLSRRALLTAGVGLTVAACTPSPTIDAAPSAATASSPGLDEHRKLAATAENQAASSAHDCASIGSLSATEQAWFKAAADAHQMHATVLTQAEPLGGVQADHSPVEQLPTPTPGATPADITAALGQLNDVEEKLVATHQEQVLLASEGAQALLWLSLLVSASLLGNATSGDAAKLGAAPTPGTAVPSDVDLGSETEGLDLLLNHQQALIFGLETMLGKTPGGSQADAMRKRLGEANKARDVTASGLRQAKATPTPGAAVYTLPGDANNLAQHRSIWATLEANVATAQARYAAVVPGNKRGEAATGCVDQFELARSLGWTLPHWPGWA